MEVDEPTLSAAPTVSATGAPQVPTNPTPLAPQVPAQIPQQQAYQHYPPGAPMNPQYTPQHPTTQVQQQHMLQQMQQMQQMQMTQPAFQGQMPVPQFSMIPMQQMQQMQLQQMQLQNMANSPARPVSQNVADGSTNGMTGLSGLGSALTAATVSPSLSRPRDEIAQQATPPQKMAKQEESAVPGPPVVPAEEEPSEPVPRRRSRKDFDSYEEFLADDAAWGGRAAIVWFSESKSTPRRRSAEERAYDRKARAARRAGDVAPMPTADVYKEVEYTELLRKAEEEAELRRKNKPVAAPKPKKETPDDMARNARGSAKELGQSFAWRHREVFRPFVHHLTDPKTGLKTPIADVPEGNPEEEEDYDTILHSRVPEFTESPEWITGGALRDYQLKGLTWLARQHTCSRVGILGDEMGLGKTLQIIAFLGWLKRKEGVPGPHLIVCPLSVMSSWIREINRWCPELTVMKLHGPEETRYRQLQDIRRSKCNIVVTTYDVSRVMHAAISTAVGWMSE